MAAHGHSIAHTGGGAHPPWERSRLLARVPGLIHGFTRRTDGDFRAGPPPGWLRAAGATRLRLLDQVHGASVASPDDPSERPRADGWAGRPTPGVLLGIRTADCAAVLLCHPPTRTLGLAHAGWRGLAGGVVERVLAAMGVPAGQVLVAVGPAVGPCCYRVGPEVVRAVGSRFARPWPGRAERFRLDLPAAVADRLVRLGVPPTRIERVGGCTACQTGRYFSYRAEGAGTGRLCAFAGWRQGAAG